LMKVKADLDKERIILEDWDAKHNNKFSEDKEHEEMWPEMLNEKWRYTKNCFVCKYFQN